MLLKSHRVARKVALIVAAIPLCQAAGGCDPFGTVTQVATGFGSIVVNSLTSTLVSSVARTLLGTFPNSDLIRLMFGNAGFFPGVV